MLRMGWGVAAGALAALVALGACKGTSTVVDGSGGSSAGSGGSAGDGGMAPAVSSSSSNGSGGGLGSGGDAGSNPYDKSECDGPEDCPGGSCIQVNGQYGICQYPVLKATECNGSALDECCNSSECPDGSFCFNAPLVPFCGGVPIPPHNECGTDLCSGDNDCPDGVCMPAGTVGNKVATCISAMCFGTVCGQESLSSCALVREPCCNGAAGFLCIDENTGCQSNADCGGGYCDQGTCAQGTPICPS